MQAQHDVCLPQLILDELDAEHLTLIVQRLTRLVHVFEVDETPNDNFSLVVSDSHVSIELGDVGIEITHLDITLILFFESCEDLFQFLNLFTIIVLSINNTRNKVNYSELHGLPVLLLNLYYWYGILINVKDADLPGSLDAGQNGVLARNDILNIIKSNKLHIIFIVPPENFLLILIINP